MTIVAFTGHRPNKLSGYGPSDLQNWVRFHLKQELQKLNPEGCISGMALGVDQWAAEICNDLHIPWVAAIPFRNQESQWPYASQETYRKILATAYASCIVSPGPYAGWKLQRRNEWMVDRADVVLAVFNGSQGGTHNCLQYAGRMLKKIVIIDPSIDVPF